MRKAEDQPARAPAERPARVTREVPRRRVEDSREDEDRPAPAPEPAKPFRSYVFILLLFALVPLGWSLLAGKDDSVGERLGRTFERLSPEDQQRIHAVMSRTDLDKAEQDMFALLPGGRIEGAHLPKRTAIHILYAVLAAGAFFGLACWLVPGKYGRPWNVVPAGLFTATVGLVFLFIVQWLAEWTQGYVFVSRNVILTLIFWVAKGIGFSYRCALDPDTGFVASFFGFTFGVGLCEEVCKALPLIWYYRRGEQTDWRQSFTWGFASGVGFGVAEAVMYSENYYNGVAFADIYVVRFISCVALHAIWAGSVALFMHKYRAEFQADRPWPELIVIFLLLVSVPMILHGLYDASLKKDMNVVALAVGLASFGWLAWCVRLARRSVEEGDGERPRRRRRRPRVQVEGE